jgi:hypothetical protein
MMASRDIALYEGVNWFIKVENYPKNTTIYPNEQGLLIIRTLFNWRIRVILPRVEKLNIVKIVSRFPDDPDPIYMNIHVEGDDIPYPFDKKDIPNEAFIHPDKFQFVLTWKGNPDSTAKSSDPYYRVTAHAEASIELKSSS